MRKFIISGGPSTGKSTTFEQLKEVYPNAHFVEEPAERVIKREQEKQQADPNYESVMPVDRYHEFQPLVVEESLALERAIPDDADLVIQDRSLIDNIGYGNHYDFTHRFPEIHGHIKAARYTVAFFCEWLGKFERTEIRLETADEGLDIHGHLQTAYHASGLEIVTLPAVTVEERLEIIRSTIDQII